ncbi:3-methyladenine DNA glycosylase [Arcanobacterium buesumense]|uniref:3-methyladenine DNA glycosylase n=1 Tax=Arcanobacterium buesumense TaxID=2722751 RepID=A0A6H2ELN2_9ACTO|nr:3-methyladenine DNA glycosylase [Arcanobacterium buesumense]QJC21988.1 3-methyladenine DNA glycosylase [Arcanobacterium buesumense]
MYVLSPEIWWPRARVHFAQASRRSRGRVERRQRGEKNALEDFLWEYYPMRPGRLAVWHPGFADDGEPYALLKPPVSPGSAEPKPWNPTSASLEDPLAWWRHHASLPWHDVRQTDDGEIVVVNNEFLDHRAHGIKHLTQLHEILLTREATFGCLGWHEWAMVYRADETRHALPLRLGAEETNRLVEQAHIRCTHFDAFQFFMPDAVALNRVQPTYETVFENEQPGCIHVSMDILRACIQLGPIIPGELLISAFDLAMRARTIDMAASPYDCSSLGLDPIRIETAAGKAEYIERQRDLTIAARPLRQQLLGILRPLGDKIELSRL